MAVPRAAAAYDRLLEILLVYGLEVCFKRVLDLSKEVL